MVETEGGDLELPLFLLLLEDPLSETEIAVVGPALEAEDAVELFFLFIGCLVLVLRLEVVVSTICALISPLFPLDVAVVVEDKPEPDIVGGDDGILLGVAAEGVDEAVLVEDVISLPVPAEAAAEWPLTRS